MMNEQRVNEIISQITAFSKETYTKSEYLPELLKLQKEVIDLTFNADHAETGDLRLWDVERHLRKMNEERGHAADDELAKFVNSSKVVCNNISAELSGNEGEQKVFRILEKLGCQNGILHNVELEFDGRRTEIDAIVFTNRAVFIIEIKNGKKNIFIDENGELYRIGNSMHHDGNIVHKMRERETMLRKALERAGMEHLKIFSILTSSNKNIDVESKYHQIKISPSNYLTSFIEKFKSNEWYSYETICTMMEAVTEVKCQEEYQMPIDMTEFKKNFAVLMAKLEAAEEAANEPETVQEESREPEIIIDTTHKKRRLVLKYGSMVAAAIGVTLVNVAYLGIGKLVRK